MGSTQTYGFTDVGPVFVVASRLVPDLDGGFGRAVLMRARDLAATGTDVTLLTVDPGTRAVHDEHRAEFRRRGELPEGVDLRNLFDEAVADPSWLRAAAHAGDVTDGIDYNRISDAAGRVVLELPIIPGNPDFHLSTASVVIRDDAGEVLGILDGFGELYRVWLDHVTGGRDAIVIVEARTIGELLVGWDSPARLVHAVHTSHLGEPYTPEAPMLPLWQRWVVVASAFDAVLWPTAAQRDDVVTRFGSDRVDIVLPHGAEPVADVVPAGDRSPHLAVMVNRLAPGKRLDHAVRIWRRVVDALPDARLDVYGEGASRAVLQEQIDAAGLTDAVRLRGQVADPDSVLDAPAVLLSTTAYEGQGLSLLEAMAHGTPVISYDVRYGPRESLADGGGILIPSGDEDAFTSAVLDVLADEDLRARLSAEAHAAAVQRSRSSVAQRLLQILRDLPPTPRRRVT